VKLKEYKLLDLKSSQQQNILFAVATNEAAVHESFAISQIIAKESKPFTDGEYVKECVMKVAEILCSEEHQLFKANNSLAANTVADRENDLAEDMQCQLNEKCIKILRHIHLQLIGVQTLQILRRLLLLSDVSV
jgi:hypothetical protein